MDHSAHHGHHMDNMDVRDTVTAHDHDHGDSSDSMTHGMSMAVSYFSFNIQHTYIHRPVFNKSQILVPFWHDRNRSIFKLGFQDDWRPHRFDDRYIFHGSSLRRIEIL